MISETEYRIARKKFESAAKDFDFVFYSPFALTDKGILVGKEIAEKVDEILKDACEGIDFGNLTIFYQGLSKININLEKAYKEKYGNELGEENNE